MSYVVVNSGLHPLVQQIVTTYVVLISCVPSDYVTETI